jgi:thiosulfate/3-mercaptopyruvate sulfurtransferase
VPQTTLVSTEWLAAQLGRADLRVVDCRFDLGNESWGHEQYRHAHIPGAVYASLSHDLSAAPGDGSGRHPLPELSVLVATLERLGIGDRTQVVAYDQDIGAWASRLWWMLRYLGHDAAAVLDGGWAKWVREGRPTQQGENHSERAVFTARPRETMRRRAEDVAAHLHDRGMLLVDARAPERFEGKHEPLDPVAGHIPGAINASYKDNVAADGTMKAAGELRAHFRRVLGSTPPDKVVMYCGSGVTACHNLLAMEHAGLGGASLYAGSWSEWSADPARPVESGPARSRGSAAASGDPEGVAPPE